MAQVRQTDIDHLTPRQQAVCALLLRGKRTEQIAQTLGLSIFTVRNHVKGVLKAYGVRSRAVLVATALNGKTGYPHRCRCGLRLTHPTAPCKKEVASRLRT